MEKLTDFSLEKVLKQYELQLQIVKDDAKKISTLETKQKLTKPEHEVLKQLRVQYAEDKDDLRS